MSSGTPRVVSVFSDAAPFVEALKRLRESGQRELSVFSPVGLPELEHLLPRAGSPIRFIVLLAGALGIAGGFWMCIGSALIYRIVVGGKLPAAWLPYCVVGFEAAVLVAGLSAIVAILGLARLRPGAPLVAYQPGFAEDRFGIAVCCADGEVSAVSDLLRDAGAEDVREYASSDHD